MSILATVGLAVNAVEMITRALSVAEVGYELLKDWGVDDARILEIREQMQSGTFDRDAFIAELEKNSAEQKEYAEELRAR